MNMNSKYERTAFKVQYKRELRMEITDFSEMLGLAHLTYDTKPK